MFYRAEAKAKLEEVSTWNKTQNQSCSSFELPSSPDSSGSSSNYSFPQDSVISPPHRPRGPRPEAPPRSPSEAQMRLQVPQAPRPLSQHTVMSNMSDISTMEIKEVRRVPTIRTMARRYSNLFGAAGRPRSVHLENEQPSTSSENTHEESGDQLGSVWCPNQGSRKTHSRQSSSQQHVRRSSRHINYDKHGAEGVWMTGKLEPEAEATNLGRKDTVNTIGSNWLAEDESSSGSSAGSDTEKQN